MGARMYSETQMAHVVNPSSVTPTYEVDHNGVVWEIRGDLRRDIGSEADIFGAWASLMSSRRLNDLPKDSETCSEAIPAEALS